MPRPLRRVGPALLGLGGLLLVAAAAPAAGPLPACKIDSVFEWRFDVKVGPHLNAPRAPWYTYFPVDPSIVAASRGSPYPPWPNPYPPPLAIPGPTPAPIPTPPTPGAAPPGTTWNGATGGAALQPVGYLPTQVPSYWYGR